MVTTGEVKSILVPCIPYFEGVYEWALSDEYTIGDGPASPLWLDGWLAWNEAMWGLKSERVCYHTQANALPRLEGVLYLNKHGQVQMPTRNPHLPFVFTSSGTRKNNRVYSQYLDVMGKFADDLLKRGIRGALCLPVGFLDARPFQWRGLVTDLRYTFMQKLPLGKISGKIKEKADKAEKMGYFVRNSSQWDEIQKCLNTAAGERFTYNTDAEAIRKCAEYLGVDSFLGYQGFTHEGVPVASALRLIKKEGHCICWAQGVLREHINSGITQLMYLYELGDVYRRGTVMFDWMGANIPTVAMAKSAWKSPLVPYLVIRQNDLRYVARTVINSLMRR